MGGYTKANGLQRLVEGVVVGYGISLCTCIVAKIAEPMCSVRGMIPVSICFANWDLIFQVLVLMWGVFHFSYFGWVGRVEVGKDYRPMYCWIF